MRPKEGKIYAIACLGPFDYNRYGGLGKHTGEKQEYYTEYMYGFVLPNKNKPGEWEEEVHFFLESEIICEAKLPKKKKK